MEVVCRPTCRHLRRKYDGSIMRRIQKIELSGKTNWGRPKRRFMDVVREDMAVVELTEEDADDRTKWRWKSAVATLCGRSLKKLKKLSQTKLLLGVNNVYGIPLITLM